MPSILADRMSQGYHFDWLSAAVPLQGRRVLEVRSNSGFLLDMLPRVHCADVCAMPLFESRRFVIGQPYGMPRSRRVAVDHSGIPYVGSRDLTVARHPFTHAIDPAAMFATLRTRLA